MGSIIFLDHFILSDFQPVLQLFQVIVGGGRLGEAFASMGLGRDVILRRGEAFPTDAPVGPIYVCTRNDALEAVIASVPEDRWLDVEMFFPDFSSEMLMNMSYPTDINRLYPSMFIDISKYWIQK